MRFLILRMMAGTPRSSMSSGEITWNPTSASFSRSDNPWASQSIQVAFIWFKEECLRLICIGFHHEYCYFQVNLPLEQCRKRFHEWFWIGRYSGQGMPPKYPLGDVKLSWIIQGWYTSLTRCASKWMTEIGPYTLFSDRKIGSTCNE